MSLTNRAVLLRLRIAIAILCLVFTTRNCYAQCPGTNTDYVNAILAQNVVTTGTDA